MTVAVTPPPFVFIDPSQHVYHFVTDLPHLGWIHLSKLSPDELKGLAQIFNLMGQKYGLALKPYQYLGLASTAITVSGIGMIYFSSNNRSSPVFPIGIIITVFGGVMTAVALIAGLYFTNMKGIQNEWETHTLQMLALKT